MPDKHYYNKDFLKDVLAGRKRLLRFSEVRTLMVPCYIELQPKNLLITVLKFPSVSVYLPEVCKTTGLLDRYYLNSVLATVEPDWFLQVIRHAQKLRKIPELYESESVIECSKEMHDLLT